MHPGATVMHANKDLVLGVHRFRCPNTIVPIAKALSYNSVRLITGRASAYRCVGMPSRVMFPQWVNCFQSVGRTKVSFLVYKIGPSARALPKESHNDGSPAG